MLPATFALIRRRLISHHWCSSRCLCSKRTHRCCEGTNKGIGSVWCPRNLGLYAALGLERSRILGTWTGCHLCLNARMQRPRTLHSSGSRRWPSSSVSSCGYRHSGRVRYLWVDRLLQRDCYLCKAPRWWHYWDLTVFAAVTSSTLLKLSIWRRPRFAWQYCHLHHHHHRRLHLRLRQLLLGQSRSPGARCRKSGTFATGLWFLWY